MIDRLEVLSERFHALEKAVTNPELVRDPKRYRDVMREHAQLSAIMEEYSHYKKLLTDIAGSKTIMREESDPEFKDLAREELRELETKRVGLEEKLRLLLVPKDPLDDKNVILEIRAGTGGEEAALFASDLFRMYSRFAEGSGWKLEVMSENETELGGFKEIVFSLTGKGVYGCLRYESGVHRVQRVPETEAGGRIHTSAVTVAVLPEIEETEINIRQEDLRIDVMRAGGPGGQCVNTTDSAVRITHLPSGIVVHCQDEKSQIKNKAKAMRILRARIFEMEEEKRQAERAAERRSQVGTGDRSERIRTYNFPQNRMTDHRIDLTLYKLDQIMQGNLGEIVEGLKIKAREDLLAETGA